MAEETNKVKVQTSSMHKGRKTIWHLQKMKDEGEKIVMIGTAILDPMYAAWADAAGADMIRFFGPGSTAAQRMDYLLEHGRQIRKMAPYSHLNVFLDTLAVSSNAEALKLSSTFLADEIDSVEIMGVTNDMLQFLSDNHVPMFGHSGILSGWQTTNYGGYKRIAKTADEAFDIWRMAYEYQEHGMKGMTIELIPAEVAQKISENLRIPVVGVAAGAPCDGSEMVLFDLLGIVPPVTAHAKQYCNLPQVVCGAIGQFIQEVKTGAYPLPEHGFSMDEAEYAKFSDMLDKDIASA